MLNRKLGFGLQVLATVRKPLRNIIVKSRSFAVTSLFLHLLYDALFTITGMRNRARFATSRQHLTHQFMTTFDNEVAMLRYAYALKVV